MSRDASPSGRSPSYGTILPRLSNIRAARKSLSPPMSDITMRGIADEPGVSLNQDQDSLQGDEDEHLTSENTPLVTSPTSNSSETSPTGLRKRYKPLSFRTRFAVIVTNSQNLRTRRRGIS